MKNGIVFFLKQNNRKVAMALATYSNSTDLGCIDSNVRWDMYLKRGKFEKDLKGCEIKTKVPN